MSAQPFCTTCGTARVADAKFCGGCGTPADPNAARQIAPQPPLSQQPQVPRATPADWAMFIGTILFFVNVNVQLYLVSQIIETQIKLFDIIDVVEVLKKIGDFTKSESRLLSDIHQDAIQARSILRGGNLGGLDVEWVAILSIALTVTSVVLMFVHIYSLRKKLPPLSPPPQ